jgi:hypothetical protein
MVSIGFAATALVAQDDGGDKKKKKKKKRDEIVKEAIQKAVQYESYAFRTSISVSGLPSRGGGGGGGGGRGGSGGGQSVHKSIRGEFEKGVGMYSKGDSMEFVRVGKDMAVKDGDEPWKKFERGQGQGQGGGGQGGGGQGRGQGRGQGGGGQGGGGMSERMGKAMLMAIAFRLPHEDLAIIGRGTEKVRSPQKRKDAEVYRVEINEDTAKKFFPLGRMLKDQEAEIKGVAIITIDKESGKITRFDVEVEVKTTFKMRDQEQKLELKSKKTCVLTNIGETKVTIPDEAKNVLGIQ